jgi:hypothetical protein
MIEGLEMIIHWDCVEGLRECKPPNSAIPLCAAEKIKRTSGMNSTHG